jgi:hypothetical protein
MGVALWNQHKQEFHLDDGVFLFASEIKAILPAMTGGPRANDDVLSDYLFDGPLCQPVRSGPQFRGLR